MKYKSAQFLVLFCLGLGALNANDNVSDEALHQIVVHGTICCPSSEEFQRFSDAVSLDEGSTITDDYAAWKTFFLKQQEALVHLVESEKLRHTNWSITVDELPPAGQVVQQMLEAIASHDYEAFIRPGSEQFQKEITLESFEKVACELGSEKYDIVYLGTVYRQEGEESLWKLLLKEGDLFSERLARVIMQDNLVQGVWIH